VFRNSHYRYIRHQAVSVTISYPVLSGTTPMRLESGQLAKPREACPSITSDCETLGQCSLAECS
jgi:hypothetical protein